MRLRMSYWHTSEQVLRVENYDVDCCNARFAASQVGKDDFSTRRGLSAFVDYRSLSSDSIEYL